ncbi:MAG: nucleotidyltransferase family protein [Chloroflexi bacterium]|nr:nucleotidyltransferase family protein [Chloroflexota bacterium]
MYAALLLAAGASSRMGRPKPLLRFQGKTLLRRAVDTAIEVPCGQVIVVLGSQANQMLPELEGTGATVVLNEQWAEGLSTSLRGGLSYVSGDARGVFIYPVDMPYVTAEVLRVLAETQHASGRAATMAEVGGVRGVPAFVTRSVLTSLMIQEGDSGGATYLRAHPDLVEAVHFDDQRVTRDVDDWAAYLRLLDEDPTAELDERGYPVVP